MDENTQFFSPSNPQLESPKIYIPKPAGSGLTLVLPSLKSLKASQSTVKKPRHSVGSVSHSSSIYLDVDTREKKIPRPIKLKPLKEVLTKLITHIKKKDDYAFFLVPVDPANIPGYSDVVKVPMDFGTMTDKVKRGKYRSLDEFASDFKLVINNAKIFNPPGSIYYTEADRIALWGLDHINKAAGTVIQYETDWTIDVEKEDEEPVNVDQDEDGNRATPMEVDNLTVLERSVSVPPSQPHQISTRRGPRGPYKREKNLSSNTLSETLEPDGGLPGSKDGIGAFPPGSDWAKIMLMLKLKGKRYKTKKERMRIERGGPPLLQDGSLDYTEMEDPFSVLAFFVPDHPNKPQLVPLYPPLYQPPDPPPGTDPPSSQTPSTPQLQTLLLHPLQSHSISLSSSTAISLDYSPPTLPFLHPQLQDLRNKSQPFSRRHWVINRNATSRQRGKEKEDDQQELPDAPTWQTPREPYAPDFGSFSVLAGALADEMERRGLIATAVNANVEAKESLDQEVSLYLIKNALDLEAKLKREVGEDGHPAGKSGVPQELNATNLLTNGYWTDMRAAEAEEYLKDVVYGGPEGFAYLRSLGEFVSGIRFYTEEISRPISTPEESGTLGMSLPQWIIDNVIDPLTEGRHSLLRETASELIRQQGRKPPSHSDPRKGTVATQVAASLHMYPTILIALSSLLHIKLHKIDMGSLLNNPDELFISEEEWAGKGLGFKKRNQRVSNVKPESGAPPNLSFSDGAPCSPGISRTAEEPDTMEVEEPEQTWASVDADLSRAVEGAASGNGRRNGYEVEGPEELGEVLEYVANVIVELDRRMRTQTDLGVEWNGSPHDGTASEENVFLFESVRDPQSMPTEEPALLRNLRLNLLALAKRAPLDAIARLPEDLVPAHIRHFVPTLGTSG